MAAVARSLEERIVDVPVLDAAGCAEVARGVQALREFWVRRHPEAPFFTLGASNYFDIAHNPGLPYYRMAAESNPRLMEHFGPLYTGVRRALADHLKMPVGFAEGLALPGFHIFLADAAFTDIVGLTHAEWFQRRGEPDVVSSPIHCDTPHFVVDWGASRPFVNMNRPISFTLAIEMPQGGAGMHVWDLRLQEAVDWPDARLHEEIARRRRILRQYRRGEMAVHDGYNFHMVAPMAAHRPGESRITLQGHGVPVHGVMRLFW